MAVLTVHLRYQLSGDFPEVMKSPAFFLQMKGLPSLLDIAPAGTVYANSIRSTWIIPRNIGRSSAYSYRLSFALI